MASSSMSWPALGGMRLATGAACELAAYIEAGRLAGGESSRHGENQLSFSKKYCRRRGAIFIS